MRLSRTRLSNYLVLLILLVLPFQTRWIFNDLTIAGQPWEYGRMSLYAVEAMIMAASALRGTIQLDARLDAFLRPTILFLGALMIGASFSQNITLAFSAILHASAAAALFALLLDERTDPARAASAFVLGLLVPSLLAWYQALTGLSPASTVLGLASHDAATLGASVVETATTRVLRGYGSLPHPNIFGGYLAIGTIVSAWLVAKGRRAGYVLPVLAATLVVTFSRSAWIATVVGLAVIGVSVFRAVVRKSPGTVRRMTLVAFASLWLVILAVATFHTPIFTRFDPTARLEEKSIAERTSEFPLWPDVIRMNAFTGVGAGNYTFALATLYPGKDIWFYQPLHNAILLFLAETGLLGLLVVARFVQVLVAFLRARRSPAERVVAISILAALLVLAVFDHYLWSLWPGMSLVAVALAIAIRA
ncbi:MAG: O-antigen ligase family protein [Candidatus Uhrbacteria bacterium]